MILFRKASDYILLIILSFFLLLTSFVYLKLAVYSYPFIDEFCYAANFQHRPALEMMHDLFRDWTSRYFANAMMVLNPLNYHSLFLFRFFACLQYFLTLFSAWLLFKPLKKGNYKTGFLSLFFLLLFFWFNQSPYESVLNFTYFWNYLSGVLFFALLINIKFLNHDWKKIGLIFLLEALIVGSSELNVFILFFVLSYFLARAVLKRENWKWELAYVLFALCLFALVFSLAGNQKQFQARGFSSFPQWKLQELVKVFYIYFDRSWLYLFFGIFGGGFFIGLFSPLKSFISGKELFSLVCYSTLAFVFLLLLFPAIQQIPIINRQFYALWFIYSAILFFCSLQFGSFFSFKRFSWLHPAFYLLPFLYFFFYSGNWYSLWVFAWQTKQIENYSQTLENLERDYYSKKIAIIRFSPLLKDLPFYPHLKYMSLVKNIKQPYCSGRYFGIPESVFVEESSGPSLYAKGVEN